MTNPFVIRGQGPGVVVDGADDFSSAAKWFPYSGGVFLASGVNWSPLQVLVDGVRLVPSSAAPVLLGVNSFAYVSEQGLYVNLGGDNPGSHATLVGHRLYGFRLSGKSCVTIEGFHVTRTENRAIYLSSASSNCIVRGNQVDFAYRYSIAVNRCSGVLVEQNVVGDNQDHGIALTNFSDDCTVQDNESARNAHATIRVANGVYLNRAIGNVIQRNRLHHNQDTGEEIQSYSDDNLSVQNISWSNGDHGYDRVNSRNTISIGDVAYGNYNDGFSNEGASSGGQIYDCIATDNGLTTNEYDLWVDSQSSVGFVSDYNIFWNSTSQAPVKYVTTAYSSLAAYRAATGQDAHTPQADPRFVGPAAGVFELRASSPAIDAGHSGVPDWPVLDAAGRTRVDDPNAANTGVGSIAYADRGALEFQALGALPAAALTVSPSSGPGPLAVTADASASTSPNGAITSYRFDFGDGTILGPQVSPTAGHTYAVGAWTATVTVSDVAELLSSTSRTVTALPPNQLPDAVIDSPLGNVMIAAGQAVNFTGTGSDPDNNAPLSFGWDFGGGAANTTTEDPGPVIFATPGTYTVAFTVTDAMGGADPTPDLRTITVTTPPVGVPADEIHWTLTGQTSVTFDWRGFDDTLRYGLTPAYGMTATGVTPGPIPWSSPGPFREAHLSGLQEDTVYHYAIGNGADHTFRTPPPRGSSGFTIFAEGDIGDAVRYPRMGTLQATIAASAPAFTLMLGDLTYGNDNGQASVDQHFNDVMAWSLDAAYMPIWGNHEWTSPALDDLRNYKGRFGLPNAQASPGSPTCCGEDWYWFDYGNVRFIAYPEPFSGAWEDWKDQAAILMDQAQADPAINFILTFGHQPAYSSGFHHGEAALKGYLDALGDSHGKYVLNLNGHSHDYERSYPQHGVVHVTAGTVAPTSSRWVGPASGVVAARLRRGPRFGPCTTSA